MNGDTLTNGEIMARFNAIHAYLETDLEGSTCGVGYQLLETLRDMAYVLINDTLDCQTVIDTVRWLLAKGIFEGDVYDDVA